MSLNNTANKSEIARKDKEAIKQGFSGYTFKDENGKTMRNETGGWKKISPREMMGIFQNYTIELKNGNCERAREIEDTNKYPITWLNHCIYDLINPHYINGNGLAEKLIEEFKDRGFRR